MFSLSHLPDLPPAHWMLFLLSALLIGMAKSGITGLGLVAIPMMAGIFGGKFSAGLLLPLLVAADLFSVRFYHRHTSWPHIFRLLPTTLAGTLIGLWVGSRIDDELFKRLIGIFIITSVALMLFQERRGLPESLKSSRIFAGFFGLLGGFSSMIGNAAGPFLSVYLLSMNLPKNNYIGTSAWFFLLLNVMKLPLHLFIWRTITPGSFSMNLIALPAIALGVLIGLQIVRHIPERPYRYMVVIMTFLLSLSLLL